MLVTVKIGLRVVAKPKMIFERVNRQREIFIWRVRWRRGALGGAQAPRMELAKLRDPPYDHVRQRISRAIVTQRNGLQCSPRLLWPRTRSVNKCCNIHWSDHLLAPSGPIQQADEILRQSFRAEKWGMNRRWLGKGKEGSSSGIYALRDLMNGQPFFTHRVTFVPFFSVTDHFWRLFSHFSIFTSSIFW